MKTLILALAGLGALTLSTPAHAGGDDFARASEQVDEVDRACSGRATRECALAAARMTCNYNGLMIRSRDRANGGMPSRHEVQTLRYLAMAMGDNIDLMLEMVDRGLMKNVAELNSAESESYCRSVGAVAWP